MKLIELPYAIDALEPVISAQTLSFHHGKHLQTYVDNLNKLIVGTEYESMTLEQIVSKAPAGPLFNNAGQVFNHNMYFTQFSPNPATAPSGRLAAQIEKQWGSLDAFKAEFEAKGVGLFGSGWVWLAAKSDGELVILQCPNADNPLCHFERSPLSSRPSPDLSSRPSSDLSSRPSEASVEIPLRPILTFDVWEHAYYLDYQNRRAAQLKELWKIVNWAIIEKRYLN